MTLDCLPAVIQAALHKIIATNAFKLNYTQFVTNTISSSIKISIEDDENKRFDLFIKFLDETRPKTVFNSESALYFHNELIFYRDFAKLSTFAPKCYHSEHSLLVMEDILVSGYKSFDINAPINVRDVRLIVQQLGRFHGASFAMKTHESDAFRHATSTIKETAFRRDGPLRKLFIHWIHDVFKLVKQSFPAGSLYVEKFAEFTLNCFDNMADLAEGIDDTDDYKVISHGDLWPSNILKSHESIIFIDYQACRYSSPVHDLMLLLLVTLDRKSRDEYSEELFRNYHRSLCETLQQFNLDPLRQFPYSALQSQLVKHTKFSMALALAGLPLYLDTNVANSSQTDLFEFIREIQSRKSMKCKNKLLEIVIYCVDHGYL